MAVAPKAIRGEPLPMATEAKRHDAWWVEPLIVVAVLGSFSIYAMWAALQNANYYVAPYLSPFYSPCLATSCAHVTLPLIGSWWSFSPALLILWIPLGFRATCYYYRKAYYRSFFWSPPACAVPDASRRYFFWLSLVVLLFLWWDALLAFRFPTGFGIGLGTVILVANAALLSLYSFSCHSCRYLCGGYLDSFKNAPLRYRLWRRVSRLNERHGLYAWISLFGVALTDLYVRLVASGAISDPRIVF